MHPAAGHVQVTNNHRTDMSSGNHPPSSVALPKPPSPLPFPLPSPPQLPKAPSPASAPAPGRLDAGIAWPARGEKFWERAPRTAPAPPLAGASRSAPPPERDSQPLSIMHISAEMAPIAKVGRAGGVVGCRAVQ